MLQPQSIGVFLQSAWMGFGHRSHNSFTATRSFAHFARKPTKAGELLLQKGRTKCYCVKTDSPFVVDGPMPKGKEAVS